jgi:GTP-binding protein HflX
VDRADEHLDELARLADTAGAEVVGRLTQKIEKPTANYYIGEGKVDELKERLTAERASLVFFDEALSPAQGVGLEKALGVRVMDRSEVILDIFATRAKSHEARLQVELAQLEYLLPRLARMWTHLSRIRGGIGLRGPGETQLETDRRAIRRKISGLRHKLAGVADHRANQRQGRRDIPRAALVGYTNAGKSSLLKALSGDDVFVEDRLFATIDTLAREVDVGEGYRVRVTDTVGFIRKLPHHLVASFRATLEEAADADVLLHVIDASAPTWEEQVEVVEEAMGGTRSEGQTRNADVGTRNIDGGVQELIHVFNKADLLPEPEAYLARVRERFPDAVLTSSVPPSDLRVPRSIDALRSALRHSVQSLRPLAQVRVPLANGKLLAVLHRDAEVVEQVQEDGVMKVTVRVEAKLLGKLRRDGVEVVVGGTEAGSR